MHQETQTGDTRTVLVQGKTVGMKKTRTEAHILNKVFCHGFTVYYIIYSVIYPILCFIFHIMYYSFLAKNNNKKQQLFLNLDSDENNRLDTAFKACASKPNLKRCSWQISVSCSPPCSFTEAIRKMPLKNQCCGGFPAMMSLACDRSLGSR